MADLSDSVAPNACFRRDTLCWVIKLLGTQRKEEQRKGEPYDWRRRVVNVVEFQVYFVQILKVCHIVTIALQN